MLNVATPAEAARGAAIAALFAAMLGLCPRESDAQEVAPFRMTGVEGYVAVRYLTDEYVTRQGDTQGREAFGELREEVFVMTHNYVYHPNFLTLDLGGGPIYQRGTYASGAGDVASSDYLYNLATRATFLRDKPYRGSVFYDHLNPTVSVAPGSVMTQENTRYGFDLSGSIPADISLDGSRFHALGTGAERIVDDSIDQVNARVSQQIGKDGSAQLRYQGTHQESTSGSPNLAIQRTIFDRSNYQFDTRLRLGDRDQYDVFGLALFDTQTFGEFAGAPPLRDEQRYLLDLRGRHSEDLTSYVSLNYSSVDQQDLSSESKSASLGGTYAIAKQLSVNLGGRADDTSTQQFVARSRGVNGSIRDESRLGPGTLSTTLGARYERRNQEASDTRVNVVGERIVLTGTTPIPLSQPRIDTTSIVVSDSARTQIFVEGVDYLVSVVGLVTRIQRIVTGNILDGQEVVVDYAYDAGGTFAYTQMDRTFSVNWDLARVLNVYFRYLDAAPRLDSGNPTTPLNEVRSRLYGARADVPLSRTDFDAMLGGLYEREVRHETISPYQRQHAEAYVQTGESFLGHGTIRLSARRVNQDFENSPQDVRLTGYDVKLTVRHDIGVDLSANAAYERDTGGPVPRTRLLATAGVRWRYRMATVTLDVSRVDETQGTYERVRNYAQVLFRRDL